MTIKQTPEQKKNYDKIISRLNQQIRITKKIVEQYQNQIEQTAIQKKIIKDKTIAKGLNNELHFNKQIKKWGNSLVIRLSPDDKKILNCIEGDTIVGRIMVYRQQQDLNPITLNPIVVDNGCQPAGSITQGVDTFVTADAHIQQGEELK